LVTKLGYIIACCIGTPTWVTSVFGIIGCKKV
jgi:hypothetical protein